MIWLSEQLSYGGLSGTDMENKETKATECKDALQILGRCVRGSQKCSGKVSREGGFRSVHVWFEEILGTQVAVLFMQLDIQTSVFSVR